jgi:hypothetical protein
MYLEPVRLPPQGLTGLIRRRTLAADGAVVTLEEGHP